MKIWVDGKLHDGKREPIAVILSAADKIFIASMKPKERVYVNFSSDSKDPDKEALAIYTCVMNALRNQPHEN